MYPYNRCIVRRSWWLSRVSSSTFSESNQEAEDTGEPRHGEELVYEESMQFPNRIMAGIFSSMVFGFVGLFFASSLVSLVLRLEGVADTCGDTEICDLDAATGSWCSERVSFALCV